MGSLNPDSGRIGWITVVSEQDAEGELAEIYARERAPETGTVDNILKIHSLHPQTLLDHANLYRTLIHGRNGVKPAEREMIAVVVSAINECFY